MKGYDFYLECQQDAEYLREDSEERANQEAINADEAIQKILEEKE